MAKTVKFDEIYERIRDYRTALLASVTSEGYVHARPMMAQEREPDADLWFVTAIDTDKVEEIRQHPQVGVIYFNESTGAYVSIEGLARIVQDRALIRSKWKETWRAWFPDGPDQENIALIAVEARGAEYWEPQGTKLTVMFEGDRTAMSGKRPEVAPSKHVDLKGS